MATTSPLLDLPVELLHSAFIYLDPLSLLNVTSTCRALHRPEFRHDAAYWSSLLRSTYRVPNLPAAQNEGERWFKLFKRMRTQTQVYTWGDNASNALGHSFAVAGPESTRRHLRRGKHVSWPEKMLHVEDRGVVSDLQCGGWSTTLLTAKGALYTVGVLDDADFRAQGFHAIGYHEQMLSQRSQPELLKYPPGFAHSNKRHDPHTAIKQFSSGRAHVLGLTDSGRIWSWQSFDHAAFHVKFIHYEIVEDGKTRGKGVVKKVVAGWNKSAALIESTGIVIWEPLRREDGDNEIEDAALVLESVVLPKTGFVKYNSGDNSRNPGRANPGEDAIGEVCNFIVLEELVLFCTHLGKLFASQIFWNNRGQMASKPRELHIPSKDGEEPSFVTDVQGSFRTFGVFTRSGAVLIGKQDRVMELFKTRPKDQTLFTIIPALQGKRVIQLAFGDHHFHALHAPGYITSYGTEPQACGALGLGGDGSPEGRLRGIRYQAAGGDGRLIPHSYTEGRRVWFERQKRAWINFLTSGGVDPAEAQSRVRMAIGTPGMQCQGEISEWVEQQGRDWESKYGVEPEDEDGLGAYFVLNVAAAGWHSGALVLENFELAEKLKQACELPDPVAEHSGSQYPSIQPRGKSGQADQTSYSILDSAITTGLDWGRWALGMPPYNSSSIASSSQPNTGNTPHIARLRREKLAVSFGAAPREGYIYRWANDHFPRLKLSDGTEMPGEVPFDEWRYDRPEWDPEFSL